MTDNTQAELDEVAQLLGIYLEEIDVDGYMPITVNRQTLAHILDWHNKQVEEVLDSLIASGDSEGRIWVETIKSVLGKLKGSSNT